MKREKNNRQCEMKCRSVHIQQSNPMNITCLRMSFHFIRPEFGHLMFHINIIKILLGSKKLGTNVLELQFVLCWQTMIKTQSLGLDLLKVCLFVKLESSDCRIYWTKSTRLD